MRVKFIDTIRQNLEIQNQFDVKKEAVFLWSGEKAMLYFGFCYTRI